MSNFHFPACVRVVIAIAIATVVAATCSAFAQSQFYYLTDIGNGPGTALGNFNAPSGLNGFSIVQPGGPPQVGIFVADTNNNRVQQITFDAIAPPSFSIFAGATAGTAIGKVNQPRGIAVDTNGPVYVADTANNRIQVNTGGTPAGWSVLAGPGTAIGQVNQPQGIAVDNTGVIYVADTLNNRIQVNSNGTPAGWSVFAGATAGTAVGKVNQPRGIFVDSGSNVFVADTGNNRIQVATPGMGGHTWSVLGGPGVLPGEFMGPQSVVAQRRSGETQIGDVLFVADTGNNRIQMSFDSGTTWSILAAPGSRPGQVMAPRGLALADFTGDGRIDLFVADTGNNRIQVYAFVPESSTLGLLAFAFVPLAVRRRRHD
jgi:sugar lactone lactonase YvrE